MTQIKPFVNGPEASLEMKTGIAIESLSRPPSSRQDGNTSLHFVPNHSRGIRSQQNGMGSGDLVTSLTVPKLR